MATCIFCAHELAPGTGKLLVKNDGRLWYFCSRKCEKALLQLNRQARLTPWSAQSERALARRDRAKAASKAGDKKQ